MSKELKEWLDLALLFAENDYCAEACIRHNWPFVTLESISYLPAQPMFGFPGTTSRAVHTKLGPAGLVTLTLRNSAVQKSDTPVHSCPLQLHSIIGSFPIPY